MERRCQREHREWLADLSKTILDRTRKLAILCLQPPRRRYTQAVLDPEEPVVSL
jgi:hypothetical protein